MQSGGTIAMVAPQQPNEAPQRKQVHQPSNTLMEMAARAQREDDLSPMDRCFRDFFGCCPCMTEIVCLAIFLFVVLLVIILLRSLN